MRNVDLIFRAISFVQTAGNNYLLGELHDSEEWARRFIENGEYNEKVIDKFKTECKISALYRHSRALAKPMYDDDNYTQAEYAVKHFTDEDYRQALLTAREKHLRSHPKKSISDENGDAKVGDSK